MTPKPHQARKRFGQNFLHDSGIINAIVSSINPLPGEHLVEIGPGLGALTKPLLTRSNCLHAIELDRDLIQHLQHLAVQLAPAQLILHNADALQFDFGSLLQEQSENAALRVVGNLPYNISSPLLFHLLQFRHLIGDMHFMLQKEVVDRIAAKPGCKTFGRLSVMLQYYCTVEALFDVPPGAFSPPPKVQSAVIRLTPKASEHTSDVPFDALQTVVQLAFAARRKTLRNNFRNVLDEVSLRDVGVDPGARAETLQIADFVALTTLWLKHKCETIEPQHRP